MPMKTCTHCAAKKPVSEFGKKGVRCGKQRYRSDCKACANVNTRKWRAKNPEKQAAAMKRWRAKRGRAKNPVPYRRHAGKAAHGTVERALRSGALVKPPACARCGKSKRLVAHHEDYEKPLEVEWLCFGCHAQHHAA